MDKIAINTYIKKKKNAIGKLNKFYFLHVESLNKSIPVMNENERK